MMTTPHVRILSREAALHAHFLGKADFAAQLGSAIQMYNHKEDIPFHQLQQLCVAFNSCIQSYLASQVM